MDKSLTGHILAMTAANLLWFESLTLAPVSFGFAVMPFY
jgi:hypothetical protein